MAKRAWNSSNPLYRWMHRNKSRSTKRGVTNVARSRKSRSRRSVGSAAKPISVLIGGAAYGAFRSKLSDALVPITSKIPLGSIADEATLFVLGYLAHRNVRDKTLRSIAMSAMAVEAALIGKAMADGTAFASSSNGGATSSSFGVPTLG